METQKKSIISIAQERGSSAQTKIGAWKYLMSHLPKPSSGNKSEHNTTRAKWELQRIESRARRIMAALGLWGRDDIETAGAEMTAQYISRNCDLKNSWPLKHSLSTWAGGDHSTSINIGVPAASGGSERAWSSNGKWSGTNSWAHISVSLGALSYFPSLRTPDGAIIIDAEKIGPREYRIVWAEQGRGFDLKTVSGYLIRGYHVRAVSLNAARKKALAARSSATETARKSRLAKRCDRNYQSRLAGIMVSVEDSIQGGNCPMGTEQERTRIIADLGNIGGISAAELLRRRNDQFAQRAVRTAYQRIFGRQAEHCAA